MVPTGDNGALLSNGSLWEDEIDDELFPWQHKARWFIKFVRSFSEPGDSMRFFVTSWAQWLKPALYSATVASEREQHTKH